MSEPKKKLEKQDAGNIGAARDMVAQLQEQAKNGQIDGAMLDQLDAILNVSVDAATDEQSSMKGDASSITDVSTAPSNSSVPSGLTAPSEGSSPSSSSSSSGESSLVKDEPTGSDKPKEEPKSESTTAPESEKESSMSDQTDDVNKLEKDEPASSRPPLPNLQFDQVDDMTAKLPEFIQKMENGKVADAQKLAGSNSINFDTMFGLAQRALLDKGGWNSSNLMKLNTYATENALMDQQQALKKAITASSVPGIYLIRLAKLMLPVYAGLVNRLPTDSPKGMGSNQATWRAQLGFGSLTEQDFFRVAEASIGVNPPTSFLTFEAPYNDIAVNDSVTLKALRASAGYSDPLQIGVIKAMSALIRGQERVTLGGNRAAISAPASVTIAQGTPAETVLAAGSYVVGITALTYEGWLAGSTGGSAAVGETTHAVCTQFVLGSGSSITATWPASVGAVAYNVYLSGSSGHYSGSTAKYLKTVTVNSAVISKVPTSTNTPPTSDTSVNATYGMEGLVAWCEKTTILGNVIPDKQEIYDNAAGALTAGNGGIEQFDSILADLWTTWHTAPSIMVMSPATNATLVGKLQSLGSGNFYKIEVANERNTVNGGMMVTGYVNKFAPFADGTPRMIDVMPHPYMPNGTVLFLSETIPYPMGNESRGFVRDVLLPYTYFPLPSQASGVNQTTYNFAITTSQTLECFNPGPQAALVGVDETA